MGTITFEELQILKENENINVGHLYNISNNFETDSDFKEGAGVAHNAGTNVYLAATGKLDCLVGMSVVGVKGDKEEIYRTGNINISAENVGAIPSDDIAEVEEVKTFLGI
jgi:hypothetical protein